jgi:Tol biopolymer transport system component
VTVGDRGQDDSAAAAPRPLNLPVTDGAFSPSFAATGAAVFFHAGRQQGGRLLEADLDDHGAPFQVVTVLQDRANNYHPRVSPDARHIAFDSDRDGERGVYVADRDGTNVHRVSGPGFAALPSWSPDMKWLAFVRAERDRPQVWNLWLRDMESGELTRLTSYRVGQTWAASWFPDAHRVCYSHEDQLVLLDFATGTADVFPSPRAGRLVRTPAVSPEGQRVIFQVFRDGAWIIDLDTRAMRKILTDATAEEFAWHPLGNRVAYHSRKDGEWRIWVTAPPS